MNDDLISRQAAIDALRDAENHAFNSFYKGLIKAHKIIVDLPSAQPEIEPKTGRWIPYRCDMYECSVCQRIHTSMDVEGCDAEYCPHCGAKMEGEAE